MSRRLGKNAKSAVIAALTSSPRLVGAHCRRMATLWRGVVSVSVRENPGAGALGRRHVDLGGHRDCVISLEVYQGLRFRRAPRAIEGPMGLGWISCRLIGVAGPCQRFRRCVVVDEGRVATRTDIGTSSTALTSSSVYRHADGQLHRLVIIYPWRFSPMFTRGI